MKKIRYFSIIILLLIGSFPAFSALDKDINFKKESSKSFWGKQFIFENSNYEIITDDDLKHLSLNELWQARNEIYARNGYIFKSEKAALFFKKLNWYKPKIKNFSKRNLNSFEIENLKKIRSYEKKYISNEETQTMEVYGLLPEGDGFLAVKESPSLKAERIDKIFNDDPVKVLKRKGNWFQITYDNKTKIGYVYKKYLRASLETTSKKNKLVHKKVKNLVESSSDENVTKYYQSTESCNEGNYVDCHNLGVFYKNKKEYDKARLFLVVTQFEIILKI